MELSRDDLICWCFEKSYGELLDATQKGESEIFLSSIKEKMAKNCCRCAELNPKGICCLGDIQKLIEEI